MPRPEKVLILIRHAHRDTTDRSLDNGLSAKGRRQVRRLLAHYRRRNWGLKPLVLSSPARRCLETVEPIARFAGTRVRVDRGLLEGESDGPRAAGRRVREFLAWWKGKGPELTVACSHGGWIPAALREAVGIQAELKKGGWSELVLEGGRVRLAWLIQSFKPFGKS